MFLVLIDQLIHRKVVSKSQESHSYVARTRTTSAVLVVWYARALMSLQGLRRLYNGGFIEAVSPGATKNLMLNNIPFVVYSVKEYSMANLSQFRSKISLIAHLPT